MSTKTRNREAITMRIVGNRVVISGDAFMQKEILKTLGFRWNVEKKCWHGHTNDAAEAQRQMLANGAVVALMDRSNHISPRNTFPKMSDLPGLIKVTIEYNGLRLTLPATPSDIESLYRQVMSELPPQRVN